MWHKACAKLRQSMPKTRIRQKIIIFLGIFLLAERTFRTVVRRSISAEKIIVLSIIA